MEAVHWVAVVGGFVAGALLGGWACWWPTSRSLAAMRTQLARAEQSRNTAVEKSNQAREQVALLNQAIADMRKSHSLKTTVADARRERADRAAQAEEALRRASAEGPVISAPAHGFADTQTMDHR